MNKTPIALLCLLGSACANITASSTDRMRVMASVPHAEVRVDGHVQGEAPITLEVPRRGNTFVEVSAPGHRPATCSTAKSVSAGYLVADIALCVLLFPIGCISFIDANGAWNSLEQPMCSVDLRPGV